MMSKVIRYSSSVHQFVSGGCNVLKSAILTPRRGMFSKLCCCKRGGKGAPDEGGDGDVELVEEEVVQRNVT